MEIGYQTPPFGFNLFYLKGIVPRGVTMGDIYQSVTPYTLIMILGLILIMLFPGLATWLPSLVL
jgi:TRAP-type mannitol/chloroaromatic compound transport system permease large subunit